MEGVVGAHLSRIQDLPSSRSQETQGIGGFGSQLVDTQIVLTTYGMMKHLLPNIKWGRIVYDEVHFLRNPKTKRYRVAIDMKSSSYVGLTGTPVNNHIVDIRSVYSVLGFPDAVLDETMSDYYEELNTKYILRRTKPDVMDENPLLQMPELSVEVHETPSYTTGNARFTLTHEDNCLSVMVPPPVD